MFPTKMFRKFKRIIEKQTKLETDAAPVDDDHTLSTQNVRKQDIGNTNVVIEEISSNTLENVHNDNEHQIIPIARNSSVGRINESNNNLALQMQNIQGQNVYQFSNCNSLHFGPVVINNAVSQNNKHPAESPVPETTRRIPRRKIKTTSIDGEHEDRFKSQRSSHIITKLILHIFLFSAMMKCDDALEPETMMIIAENLGKGWRDVIRQLGFSDGKIEQLYEENLVKGIKEVIYQFLLDWCQRDENANLGAISRLLWQHHWEVVFFLKEHWKAKRSKHSGSEE